MTTNNIVRIMLDLETMSLEDNAAIVQIGACTFDLAHTFSAYISPESSERAGLHVSKETMAWWDGQDEELRKRVFGGTVPIRYALDSFHAWVMDMCEGNVSRLRIYANGPEFDWVVLKNAFYAVLNNWPFSHRAPNSLRTLKDAAEYAGVTYYEVENKNKHDALADAMSQADIASQILDKLRSI